MTTREIGDVAVAVVALRRAQRRVRRDHTGALVRPHAARSTEVHADTTAVLRAVRRADLALARALRLMPSRPSCLVRTLALTALLERAGVPGACIRVGVRRDGTALDAHAWVELEGRVVGDDPHVARRFTPLGSVTSARPT